MRVTTLMVLIGALAAGVTGWVASSPQAPKASALRAFDYSFDGVAASSATTGYFPSQYVNQAKDVEPHVDSF